MKMYIFRFTKYVISKLVKIKNPRLSSFYFYLKLQLAKTIFLNVFPKAENKRGCTV